MNEPNEYDTEDDSTRSKNDTANTEERHSTPKKSKMGKDRDGGQDGKDRVFTTILNMLLDLS